MASHSDKGFALVTGASSGIGKVYAERLARRGYDLVLVARDKARLEALAAALRAETGRQVEVIPADLGVPADLRRIEARLAAEPAVTFLVNNAGIGTEGAIRGGDIDATEAMIQLNVTALARLSFVAVNRFAARGGGTLVNIASVVAYMGDQLQGAYSGTKAFVLNFTQSLQNEFAQSGIRIQAVLPGLTRTEFFGRVGRSVDDLPPDMVMSAEDLVDAALVGLDQGERVTIPPLPELAKWEAVEAARMALLPDLSRARPGARYGIGVKAAT
ncbi:SDR family NAD(P)-dependent oxidoreductase [Ancylobacter terrae]|uniref:SDR family NAD(P)-dependent oxidoreductase n=1 Tax=Ancylobacter sp. sgz301288 TaxID=3342077 RepID=UPI00385F7779